MLFGVAALVALAGGHMLGQDVGWGRVVFAGVAAAGNLTWWQIGITINNDLTAGVAAPSLPSLIQPNLGTTVDPTAAVGTVLLVIVYAIVVIMALFSLVFRLGMIDILICVGSLALFCYVTPWSAHFAKTYTRLALGLLFSQVLVVLGFRVASVLGTAASGVAGTLLSMVVLVLIMKLPGLLAGSEASRTGAGIGAAALLLVRRRVGL
jgi:hypothetical protein